MTEYLIAARAVIILWTNLAVMPAEIVFDAIEAELERRGVESLTLQSEAIRCASCLERHGSPSEIVADAWLDCWPERTIAGARNDKAHSTVAKSR